MEATEKKGNDFLACGQVLPQRSLIYWKQYFMLDFLSHTHRDTTAGCWTIGANSLENVNAPFERWILSALFLKTPSVTGRSVVSGKGVSMTTRGPHPFCKSTADLHDLLWSPDLVATRCFCHPGIVAALRTGCL